MKRPPKKPPKRPYTVTIRYSPPGPEVDEAQKKVVRLLAEMMRKREGS